MNLADNAGMARPQSPDFAQRQQHILQSAAKLFADIAADPNVPETIRGRAKNMAASLSARQVGSTNQGQTK